MPPQDPREMAREVFTVPNALSLLRLAMVPVVVVLLFMRADVTAVVVFILAAITDFLDGALARRTRPTLVGKILDPVADRLMLSSAAVVLAIREELPIWVVAILVGRDLLALVGGLAFGKKISVNLVGKAATALLMVAVALIIFSPGTLGEIIFYAGFGLSLVAGLLYVINISRVSGGGGTT
ncbi:MAG TPA: CDP-alcohol phosphatidyltransferase family protein [Rubrobacteraceae bacterium]|nr:CDP-alcohol phosphatidyltransferase family protein [Rubrobacteraceae bacterium]